MNKAKVFTAQEVAQLRYPISDSMVNAAGLLKGRKINALSYQKQTRKVWEKRLKKQTKLALG